MADHETLERLHKELAEAVHAVLEGDEGPCGHSAVECPSTRDATHRAISLLNKAGWIDRIDLTAAVRKLELSEGDVIVVQLPKTVTAEQAQSMGAALKKLTDHPVVGISNDTGILSLQDFLAVCARQAEVQS